MKKTTVIISFCLILCLHGYSEQGKTQGCLGFSIGSEFLWIPFINFGNNTYISGIFMVADIDLLISYGLIGNIKVYFGANGNISGLGLMGYIDMGAGYEFRLNNYFSIEPMVLAGPGNLGSAIIALGDPNPNHDNSFFIIKSLFKFNLIVNSWFKVYCCLGAMSNHFPDSIMMFFASGITFGR